MLTESPQRLHFQQFLVLGLSQGSSSSENAPNLRIGLFGEKMCAQVLAKDTATSLALPLQPMPNNARKCKN